MSAWMCRGIITSWRVFGRWLRACALARQRAPDGQRVGGRRECITRLLFVRFTISDKGAYSTDEHDESYGRASYYQSNGKCAWLYPSFCSVKLASCSTTLKQRVYQDCSQAWTEIDFCLEDDCASAYHRTFSYLGFLHTSELERIPSLDHLRM